MTSNKLNVRTRTSAFLSVLLAACISHTAMASNTAVETESLLSSTPAIDNHFSERPTVDSAPDNPLTAEQLAQIPDAVPMDEPLSKYGNVSPYRVLGESYTVMAKAKRFKQVGLASWYGKKFHGQRTSSGERFDMYKMTAAHKNLPIPCYVRVTNQENGKSVVLKVNDRGPFHGSRVMDVSWAAAAKLDMLDKGTAKISIEVIDTSDKNRAIATVDNNATSATTNEQFFVQVGAFGTVDNALSLQSKLSSIVPLPIEISDVTQPKRIHKVQIGPFADAESAEKARSYLLQVAAVNPIIIRR
ncbi:rare lipoprotein A [Agitococcus lubricus]|uniref:Endolytic peptidoglycan transglycosylase RlpA n=1 Tax=Agitococcus lubricus TaxID=1077255 RepID=A0A2T5J1S7_9GAMM|nr:rare lipoprotein A [Agitococcus lubricus]